MENLEKLIAATDGVVKGEDVMKAFDNSVFDQYKKEAKERWGNTDAYKEHAEKTKSYSKDKWNDMIQAMNDIFAYFAACMNKGEATGGEQAQNLACKLQSHITENYYTCTKEILAGLGKMYVGDERFKKNIDKHGEGTAAFASEAIAIYCDK